ncbi:MAG TPA: RdgB/HAM1 family non-canonical purine NTP pyrophosphatase [Bacteroides sp.]|nr:RdgB/HAM1 family non-canonical purine NTP pyrophosphatase [Bacteroides sp.]
MELIFATNNPHKLKEVGALLGASFQLCGLREKGITDRLPEDRDTLEGNAMQKARYVYDRYALDCFADDTGLEVDALNGEPGVFSARYSRMGDPVFPEMEVSAGNVKKLLIKMEGMQNRKARFRTVIALVINGTEHLFEGRVEGNITQEPAGTSGFGYDPVFRPDGYEGTFAQMDLSMKNQISHRAIAARKLAEFLKNM